jgi:hypothetical protein
MSHEVAQSAENLDQMPGVLVEPKADTDSGIISGIMHSMWDCHVDQGGFD